MMALTIPKDILQGWKVLVVDDEPDAVLIVQTLLRRYGAEVIIARNGQEGIDMVRKHHPRFVVADLSMPEVSGWQMVNVLKNDRSTISIPIVALTAHAMKGD